MARIGTTSGSSSGDVRRLARTAPRSLDTWVRGACAAPRAPLERIGAMARLRRSRSARATGGSAFAGERVSNPHLSRGQVVEVP